MKNLNFIDKLIYLLNGLVALVLLFAYLLPFVAPKNLSILSVLSLSVPVLILLNACFCLYWLLKVKKQLLLSLFVLVLGYKNLNTLYKFSSDAKNNETSLSVMSYNVRLFNIYNWIDAEGIENKIAQFVLKENVDVIAFQEFNPHKDFSLPNYKYKYQSLSGEKMKYGQAIFSKNKIINNGEIKFLNTNNKAIYIDVVKNSDTLRIYNVHFESLHINPDIKYLSQQKTEYLVQRIGSKFAMQQEQAELILRHQQQCDYKKIILGDFNNTAYSYIYKQFKNQGYKDAFEISGEGFGKTFDFKFFPLRIDFILVDENIELVDFSNFSHKYSDHYPIKASVYF
jgi:endonuclease/exonuclease/phosphatase family metal-dependent hydrolase